MNEENGTTPSIRDTIANAIENHVPEPTTTEASVQQVTENVEKDRSRDEQGRFSKTEQQKTEDKTTVTTTPEKPKLQRPSSWKKDYWGHYDKLTAGQQLTPEEAYQLAEYVSQREQEYAKGVSTYKTEWDKAKPYLDSMQSIAPLIQQQGIDTSTWLRSAQDVYRAFMTGNPQQKLGTLFQLAAQYQVPIEEIFDQSEDGRWYLNTQKFQSVNTPVPAQQPDVRKTVQEILQEERANEQVRAFTGEKEKYPHVEQVRETMAGLLRAGLVEDLQSAYQAALRMPQHAELFESIQRQQREEDERKKREESERLAKEARAKTISPRSSTTVANGKMEKGKGIRSIIEDAMNERTGRV